MSLARAFAETLPGVSPDVYDMHDFRAISDIVYAAARISMNDGKAMLVYSRLSPLVRETQSRTFANYIALLREDPKEHNRAVEALTTNHTYFYREDHHFQHFANTVRPELASRLLAGGSARLWSAGCSSGEETWSLVMTLLGQDRREGLRIAKSDVRILASDIARHVLEKASAATYPAHDLEPVPANLRTCWTRSDGVNATIDEDARSIVRFRELNLHQPWPMKRKFDVIFCRNVMIYFDNATKEKLVARFSDALASGGILYIGHSERVMGQAMRTLVPIGPTIYRKVAA